MVHALLGILLTLVMVGQLALQLVEPEEVQVFLDTVLASASLQPKGVALLLFTAGLLLVLFVMTKWSIARTEANERERQLKYLQERIGQMARLLEQKDMQANMLREAANPDTLYLLERITKLEAERDARFLKVDDVKEILESFDKDKGRTDALALLLHVPLAKNDTSEPAIEMQFHED